MSIGLLPNDPMLQLQARTTPANFVYKNLRDGVAAALWNNPEVLPVISGVTVTVDTVSDVTLTNNYQFTSSPQSFGYAGGRPLASIAGPFKFVFPVATMAPSTTGNIGSPYDPSQTLSSNAWEVWAGTEAPKLQFEFLPAAATTVYGFRVKVAGRYVSKAITAFATAGVRNYIHVDMTGLGSYDYRTVSIELSGQTAFYGAAVSPTFNLSKPTNLAAPRIGLVTGDSYSESVGASHRQLGYAPLAGRKLGLTDLRQVAVGSTGYLADSQGTRMKIRDQIPFWASVNSDINMNNVNLVIVGGGFNDYTYPLPALSAEISATLPVIRNACPYALIVVLGSWCGSRGPNAPTIAVEKAVLSSFQSWNDPLSLFIPIATASPAWVTGTGKVGATTGTGNSDLFTATDGIHSSDDGHNYYSERLIAEIRNYFGLLR